jgi:hypothetical protein
MIRQVLTLILAFVGGFLAVGGWIWAPKISSAMSSFVSTGPSVSLFADANRIGRPETAPVIRGCIFKVVDLGPDAKMEPSAAYFILKAGSMQANVSTMLGKSDRWSENQTINLAAKWGELANCIYAQEDREFCDADNRAAAVEATTKFFAYAKQTEAAKPAISADDARAIEGFGDRLLTTLKNHRRYGTLVAADFGSFASPEIMRIMREEKETRDICKVDVRRSGRGT